MNESKVMKGLRETRDKISEEIKDMNSQQTKEYFRNNSQKCLNEIKKIRESRKAI
jgi:hypothetical protein